MKYHSDTLVPHKSAVMACPANLLAEEVCLPAALVKKTALENNIAWMQRYAGAARKNDDDAMDFSGPAAGGSMGYRGGKRLAGQRSDGQRN